MPRYCYACETCDNDQTVFHSYSEMPVVECKSCDRNMIRVLTKPYIDKNTMVENPGIERVGQLTEEYIKKNREVLDNEKKEQKGKTYEPS